jgi:carbonic anhydrase
MENDTVRPFWRNPETHFPTYANRDAIMTKIAPAVSQAKTYAKPDELVESAIKDNVDQSTKDVLANGEIIRDAVHSGKLKVVEAGYMLDTGEVVRLNAPKVGQD